ncbi:conserved hypothetical protein [Ricinus communis]|uniref:Uncharacterized protein n=1 Tax=Ricinus communis TaxID=3988 RepID=B9SRM7_RICCO|nr:conserved hypothetical protein [Ricinus communis]
MQLAVVDVTSSRRKAARRRTSRPSRLKNRSSKKTHCGKNQQSTHSNSRRAAARRRTSRPNRLKNRSSKKTHCGKKEQFVFQELEALIPY